MNLKKLLLIIMNKVNEKQGSGSLLFTFTVKVKSKDPLPCQAHATLSGSDLK